MDRIILDHNAPEVAKAIRRRGADAIARVDQALGRGAHEVARDAQRRAPKFRSEIATRTQVDHAGPLHWEVVFASDHAAYVEEGTGPGGRPTLAELLDWIRLRGITPRSAASVESLAYLIRRKIAREGTPAQPFAEPALRANRMRLVDLVQGAASAAMAGAR